MLALVSMSACSNSKTMSLKEFYKKVKIEKIDNVIIQDGSTGASKTITEQDQINEFLSLIKDVEFTPQENQDKGVGWRYRITLFDREKEFKFTTEQIADTYYDSNPDILPIIDSYYQQLNINEK